jgi:hypothetical protein
MKIFLFFLDFSKNMVRFSFEVDKQGIGTWYRG